MRISRPIAVTTLAATALAGGLGGALLLGPASADTTSTPAGTASGRPAATAAPCREGFAALADAIGISSDDLRAALRDGQTIAQVAEAHGVDPQDVIDALVAHATERITKVVNGDTVRQRC
jgi:hypothetical protein